jgi:hypothetical protein
MGKIESVVMRQGGMSGNCYPQAALFIMDEFVSIS